MICETKTTKGSAKSMQYQANDKGFAVEVARNGLVGDNPKDWHRQMSAIEKQYDRANFENKRVTQVISLTKEEAKEFKSGKDWEDLAKKHYEKKGIDLKNHAYIMHTHGSTKNPHLHITVSRVTFEGKQGIKSQNIGEEFGKITDEISKERGWNTAKETAELNRKEVGKNIDEVLHKEKVKDFEEFKSAMGDRGYYVKLSHSEAKGTYGMRIIPQNEYTETPSPRLAKSGQGYKLSEIQKVQKNTKFKISDIKSELNKNKIEHINRQELFKKADERINNRLEELCKNSTNINFGSDIDPILREEIKKEFPNENIWSVIDKEGGKGYQDNLNIKAQKMIEEKKSSSKDKSLENKKTQVSINRFDQIVQKHAENKEKNQAQEKNRGFRR